MVKHGYSVGNNGQLSSLLYRDLESIDPEFRGRAVPVVQMTLDSYERLVHEAELLSETRLQLREAAAAKVPAGERKGTK